MSHKEERENVIRLYYIDVLIEDFANFCITSPLEEWNFWL